MACISKAVSKHLNHKQHINFQFGKRQTENIVFYWVLLPQVPEKIGGSDFKWNNPLQD